jgi:serine/threonine protein kinase
LKPTNFLLDELGHVVFSDFGSPRRLSNTKKVSDFAGTVEYAAPELYNDAEYD